MNTILQVVDVIFFFFHLLSILCSPIVSTVSLDKVKEFYLYVRSISQKWVRYLARSDC